MAIMLGDQLRRTLKTLARDHHHVDVAPIHHRINARARLQGEIAAHQVAGQVSLVREGVDCNGERYVDIRQIEVPTSLVAFEEEEVRRFEWLDRSEKTFFATPDITKYRAAPVRASNDDQAAPRAA